MTAKEYLAQLALGLDAASRREGRAVDALLRKEVLAEMEGHVEEMARRKPGLSEEEVVASLTPPDILAESLFEELAPPAGPRPDAGPASGPGPDGAAGKDRDGPSSRFGASGRPDAFSAKEGRGYRRNLRRFAGGSRTETIDWDGILPADGIEEVWLEFPVADLEVLPGSGRAGGIEVECEVEAEADVLSGWTPESVREGKALLLRDGEDSQVRRLTLRFPPSVLRFSLETRSGDVEVEAGERDLRVKTASGDIVLESAARASVETASGDVEIASCEAAAIVTGSGDVSVEEALESLVVRTGSGSVEAESAAGMVKVETGSGDVDLRLEGGRVLVTTSSGSIGLEAGADFEGGSLVSSSGDISVSLSSPRLSLRAESVSGDVSVDDEDGGDRVPRRVVRELGGGGPDFVLRSASGSVEVDLD